MGETSTKSPYPDSVACPMCRAKPGDACTFVHFATRQRIATSFHASRIKSWRDAVARKEEV